MERVIVTGGSGFLGTNFLRGMGDRDVEIVVISRRRAQWQVSDPRIRYVEQDVRDLETYRAELTRGSTVIHMASTTYPGSAEKVIESEVQDNVLSSVRLAQACAEAGVAHFIFLSSGGAIYGDQDVSPIPESAHEMPISAYGVMKLSIEHYLRVLNRLRGLRVTSARVGNPFGPWHDGHGQGAINVFLYKALHGESIEIWGDGSQVRDYIPVEDVTTALWAMVDHVPEHFEVYNIGTGVGRTLKQVMEDIGAALEKEINARFSAGRLVDVHSNVLDVRKAKEMLGWEPKMDYQKALTELVLWAKKEQSNV